MASLETVRSALRERGGEARVVFTGAERLGYRPFRLVLALPAAAAVRAGLAPSVLPVTP